MNLHDVNRGIHEAQEAQARRPRPRLGPRQDRAVAVTRARAQLAGWSARRDLRRRSACRWCAAFPSAASTTRFAMTVAVVNVGDLDEAFEAGDEVTPESLCRPRTWPRAVTTSSRFWATAS